MGFGVVGVSLATFHFATLHWKTAVLGACCGVVGALVVRHAHKMRSMALVVFTGAAVATLTSSVMDTMAWGMCVGCFVTPLAFDMALNLSRKRARFTPMLARELKHQARVLESKSPDLVRLARAETCKAWDRAGLAESASVPQLVSGIGEEQLVGVVVDVLLGITPLSCLSCSLKPIILKHLPANGLVRLAEHVAGSRALVRKNQFEARVEQELVIPALNATIHALHQLADRPDLLFKAVDSAAEDLPAYLSQTGRTILDRLVLMNS
eukprot:TRINITY_DN49902_c0_g1_i2.p1 TRINITY_DN49902_c0_g1~~TRINITY_DN49902_c0_g1_i2.p1  ORF type:complete len:267 (-),score=30.68 TRINITY_DN49902_c0_g1_i2:285-1085(-)